MAVAGLLNRLVGFAYRVLLVRLVGEEGVGLLQMLLPLWGLVATLASLGLPVALSRAVARHSAAGNWRAVAAVIARTATGLVASGATAAVGLWLAAPLIGRFVYSDPRVRTALLVLPAGVFVSTAAGTLRGYFHGRQNLVRVAAAQVVEQFVRVPAVLLLAAWLLPLGLGAAAAGAIAGMVAGEAAAAFYLLRALTQEQTHPRPWSRGGAAVERARDLLPVALPVMVGGLLTTISALADALLIPRRLEAAGVLSSQATALYGQWTGMALPVLYLPMVAVYPIETAVLPTISAAHALGQWSRLHRSVAFTTAYAAAVGTLTGAALWAAPGPLVRLLYGDDGAAGLVAALAPAAPFTYVQNMQVPILQGLGRTSVALRNYAVGVCLRLTLLYVLTAVPAVGILAAPLSMAASQALMCVLHGLSIRRATAGR